MITVNAVDSEWLYLSEGVSLETKVSNLNWSGSIKPLLPITIFGKSIPAFQIGKYGQLKFMTKLDGRFLYSGADHDLPESMEKLMEGYQIIPFGEPMKIKGCGERVLHGICNGKYIVHFYALGLYSKVKQQFQVVFDPKKHNEVLIQYKSVFTGYNTIVGAICEPGNAEQWYPLENHQYRNKAILINTFAEVGEESPSVESPIEKPPGVYGPIDEPIKVAPAENEWSVLYKWNDTITEYLIQRRRK